MKAFVFTDPSLERHAGRFVWLAIDTERSKNASFRKKFPVQALPTFFVIDPADEKVAIRWVGGMTVPQLTEFLSRDPLAGKRPRTELDATLARADSLYGTGDNAGAAPLYAAALRAAPADWPHAARATDALLYALGSADQPDSTMALARAAMTRFRGTPTAFNAAVSGLDAALQLPESAPHRAAAIAEFEAASRAMIADTSLHVAADDRSGTYGYLVDARDAVGDSAGAKRVAGEWAAFLEGEAKRARNAQQRAVFDPHRLSAYLAMGEPARAVPMLEQTHKDFPSDYNPLARLAVAYREMGKMPEALENANAAMAKAYGPRKLRIYDTMVSIHQKTGDTAAARKTLEEELAFAQSLPDGQRSDASIARIKKQLEATP